MKITVEATVSLEDVLAETSRSDVLDALDMDEVLHEIDKDTMVSFVANNYGNEIMGEIGDYEVIRHVSRNISMGSLIDDLDEGDKAELREILAADDEPDQPKLTADQWDLIKCGLKAIITLRGLIGSGQPGDARGRKEQAIVDLINNHFPS